MKKAIYILTLISLLTASHAMSQRINKSFRNVSLSDALIAIDKASEDWHVSFIYDELEDFKVTCDINNQSVPDAVHTVVGFYPMDISLEGNIIYVECRGKGPYKLMGRLVDIRNTPISYANISITAPNDTSKIATGVSNESGWFTIPCEVENAIVKISHVGFVTIHRNMAIKNIGTIRMQDQITQINNVDVSQGIKAYSMYLDDDYSQYADHIRQKVWEMNSPHFVDTVCPKKFRDSSSVILAKYFETNIIPNSDKHIEWAPFIMTGLAGTFFSKGAGSYTSYLYRIRVKINDFNGVNEWSYLKEYKKKIYLKKRGRTFMGVRIIKPNGKVIDVNVDQYVCPGTWKNPIKKRPKDLPIKHLNRGDILDLFWYYERVNAPLKADEKTMLFTNSPPILYQQYKYALGPQFIIDIEDTHEDITVKKGFDKYGNQLFSIEKTLDSIPHPSNDIQSILRYQIKKIKKLNLNK